MLWYSNKPEWLSEQLWRTWRTFLQVLLPAVSMALAQYANTHELSIETLYYTALIPAIAAAIAALSNRPEDIDDDFGVGGTY